MRKRLITLLAVGLVLALFVVPAAAAELFAETDAVEADEEAVVADEEKTTYSLSYNYDPDAFVLLFGFADDSAEEGDELDCSLDDDVNVTVDEDGNFVYEDDEGTELEDFQLAEGCMAVSVVGPNGQVNHGTVVSNTVHALKDAHNKDIHGPFGHFVRDIARSELGKGDQQEKPDKDGDVDALDTDGVDIDDDSTKPNKPNKGDNKGKKKGKNK